MLPVPNFHVVFTKPAPIAAIAPQNKAVVYDILFKAAFTAHLRPLRQINGVVCAKRPYGGPQQVLNYLSRYTYLIAIANGRIICIDDAPVRFC